MSTDYKINLKLSLIWSTVIAITPIGLYSFYSSGGTLDQQVEIHVSEESPESGKKIEIMAAKDISDFEASILRANNEELHGESGIDYTGSETQTLESYAKRNSLEADKTVDIDYKFPTDSLENKYEEQEESIEESEQLSNEEPENLEFETKFEA